jgi:predicted flap endonuclease-1-like 5' DNA nuclease
MAKKKPAYGPEKTVKIDLGWTFGVGGKNYGPGKDIEVPLSVARSLGKVPAPETSAAVAAPAPVGDGLPDDFPGRAQLTEAGITTISAVRAHEDLTSIEGIGTATVGKIQEALGAK